jgi:hypothetical protein
VLQLAYNKLLLWFIPWLGLPLSFDENLCWAAGFRERGLYRGLCLGRRRNGCAGLGFLFWRSGRRFPRRTGVAAVSRIFVLFPAFRAFPFQAARQQLSVQFSPVPLQYIPNAFVVLVLVLVCDRFVVTSRAQRL